MWWIIASTPDFWGRGPGFKSDIFHSDPDALQDHCVYKYVVNLKVERQTYTEAKKIMKNNIYIYI